MSVARSSNNHNNNDHSGSSSSSSIDRNTDGITDSPDGLGNISITGGGGTGGVGSGQSIGQRAAEPVAFLQTARPSMALGNALRGAAGGVAGEEVVTSPGAMLATVNRTERGQKLRALNWVKQVGKSATLSVSCFPWYGTASGTMVHGTWSGEILRRGIKCVFFLAKSE